MPDIFTIGDTIRFTASIADIEGNPYDPEVVTVSVLTPDGKTLLDDETAIRVATGNYKYDWTIEGVTNLANLIVVWNWVQGNLTNKKRMKFRVVPETHYY